MGPQIRGDRPELAPGLGRSRAVLRLPRGGAKNRLHNAIEALNSKLRRAVRARVPRDIAPDTSATPLGSSALLVNVPPTFQRARSEISPFRLRSGEDALLQERIMGSSVHLPLDDL